MKSNKYHTLGTFTKYNGKNHPKNIHIHDRSLSWLRSDTLIKSGGVKLVVWIKTLSMVENNKNCDGSIILQNVSGSWCQLIIFQLNYVSSVKIDDIVPSTPIENQKSKQIIVI